MVNKKVLCAISVVVASSVILGSICLGVFANNSEPTGVSQETIAEYEASGISTYIGQGYNIVDKNYINAADVQKSYIFNTENKEGKGNIRDTRVAVDKGSTSIKTYNVESTSVSTFIKNCLNEISGGIGINLDWCGFTQIKPSASFSYSHDSNKKNNNQYIKHVRQMETAYVNWMLDEDDYYNYLTESFKKDVMTMEPLALFKKYGTHVLTGVKMGGKVELTYQMTSDNEDDLKKATGKISLDIAGIFSGGNSAEKSAEPSTAPSTTPSVTPSVDPAASASTAPSTVPNKDNTNNETKKEEKKEEKKDNNNGNSSQINYTHNNETHLTIDNVFTTVHTSCYGGNGEDMSTVENMKAALPNWIKNVPEAPALVGVLGDESLYPVWNLVNCIAENDNSISKEAATARIKELQEAFQKYGKENYESIIAEDLSKTDNKKQVVALDIEPVGVKVNTGFDTEQKVSENRQALHEGYDLGKILLVDAEQRENGTYKYNEEKGLKIRFRLDQNINKLPVGNTKSISHRVNYNNQAFGSVDGYGNVFGNHLIKGLGKGCYFVQVTYNDQTTETVNAINFLDKMNKNETTTFLDTRSLSVPNHDGIDKINIFVTYQTVALNYINSPVQDWVVEKELDFE